MLSDKEMSLNLEAKKFPLFLCLLDSVFYITCFVEKGLHLYGRRCQNANRV